MLLKKYVFNDKLYDDFVPGLNILTTTLLATYQHWMTLKIWKICTLPKTENQFGSTTMTTGCTPQPRTFSQEVLLQQEVCSTREAKRTSQEARRTCQGRARGVLGP